MILIFISENDGLSVCHVRLNKGILQIKTRITYVDLSSSNQSAKHTKVDTGSGPIVFFAQEGS